MERREDQVSGISVGEEYKLGRMSSGRPGQPAYEITKEMLLMLVKQEMTKAQMAKMLNVANSTIQRRLRKFNISLRQMRSSNRKGTDSTGWNSDGQGQGVLTLRTVKGMQSTPEQGDVVASHLPVTSSSFIQSGKSIIRSIEMAEGPSFSPTETHTESQGRISKRHRITATDFQGTMTDKDIDGEDYPDVDLQNESTVEKGLVPDVSPPTSSQVLMNIGDDEKRVHADKAQHGGAMVKGGGGGAVAECGVGEGYDVRCAVGPLSEASFGENIRAGEELEESKSMGILDESLNKIVLQLPFQKLIPGLKPLVDEWNGDGLSFQTQTEMPLDALASVPNPETEGEKIKSVKSEVQLRFKEAFSDAVAPTTVPFKLSDDRKPGSDGQYSGMAQPTNSQPQEQGPPFSWQGAVIPSGQPWQGEDMTDPDFAQLVLNCVEQETVNSVSSDDIDIDELEQLPELPEDEQKGHTQPGVLSMGQQNFWSEVAFSHEARHTSLLTEHPPEQGSKQAVAGQGQRKNKAGDTFQTNLIHSGQPGYEQDLGPDFSEVEEFTPMFDSALMPKSWQDYRWLDMEGVPHIMDSGRSQVEQQMLSQGGIQNEVEDKGGDGQPVDGAEDLVFEDTPEQFLNEIRQEGVEGGGRRNVPRFDMICD